MLSDRLMLVTEPWGVIPKALQCAVNRVDTALNSSQPRITVFDQVIMVNGSGDIGCGPRPFEPHCEKTGLRGF